MKNKKNKILLILTLSPMLVSLAILPFMNDEIPANYDIEGNITSIGSKYETLVIPAMIILAGLVWAWIIRTFNQRYESEVDEKVKSMLEKTLNFTYNCAFVSIGIFILIQLWVLVGSL